MSDTSTDETERYEVVIRPDGGYDGDHADLLRKRLLNDGFYKDVVSVRQIEPDTEQSTGGTQ